ncbi:glyoxalase [Rugamonas sp.]|uniref:VOC family protein n=1 Tax=Rugamonas sp. TaxID=1926287 RepID=UPI0025E883F7|nr:glyoxalase [Rugamonas sp.]
MGLFSLLRPAVAAAALVLGVAGPAMAAAPLAAGASVAVGPQYDTTHVYVSSDTIDAFVASFVATFDGKASPRAVFTVTPTPSKTASQYIQTPVGMLSVFAFQTPVPYPFGDERTGYLVTDMDSAVAAALKAGADVMVDSFDDPIGKDAIIAWPGGLKMQLYWHTKAPQYAPLLTVPDNRVYLSRYAADHFIQHFLAFSHGKVVLDQLKADGGQIGLPGTTFRQIKLESGFGKMAIFVTDGKLPYPYGRETTGYQVADVDATIAKAVASGAKLLSPPYTMAEGRSAIIEFPGAYIAEIHDVRK